ncbi:hypothetical protein PENTCL1PPCAC_19920 [Pristionchus entomophagus]|uniref:Potassium channel domain-containing protein n=1 Tax=Pristionchus entomophagus TaxID=358040 RepID=A0AAV5TTC0_9BILA|nr:hypothetical protein PENTCL1PPCAC_19920 [Pristionchus entomophagus]
MTSAAKKPRPTVIVKLPEKRESLREKLRRHLKEVAPYFLHLGIVFAVTVYVLVGAYAIREIERLAPGETHEGETTSIGPEISRFRRDIESTGDLNRLRKQSMNRTRRCVIAALHRLRRQSNCSKEGIEKVSISTLDECYEKDVRRIIYEDQDSHQGSPKALQEDGFVLLEDGSRQWKWTDSVLFCFTVITTIGYGNVAPRTFEGRLFVIFYGLIGVPFTMLAIANLGKFLAALLKSWTRPFIRCFGRMHRRCFRRGYSPKERQRLMDGGKATKLESNVDEEEEEEMEEAEEDSGESSSDAFVLFVSFVLYVIVGSFVISAYEKEMNFFEAIYFNFVTLTTIGLGDLVPKSETFLLATLIYCAVGLALTTIAIEIAADYLKKLHYFGRKIENVGHVKVWFGGQQISMRQLVKNLGDQFNVPVDQLQGLNLEQFVDDAMRVESGELATLRTEPKAYETSNYWRAIEGSMLHFVDDDDVIAAQAAQNLRRSISWSVGESPVPVRTPSPRPARATSARLNAASSPRPVAKPNPPMNLDEALMNSLKRELARRKRAIKLSSFEAESDSDWEWMTERRRRLQSVATARRATGTPAQGVESKDETPVHIGQRSGGGRRQVQPSGQDEMGGVPHGVAALPDDEGGGDDKSGGRDEQVGGSARDARGRIDSIPDADE